MSFRYKTILGIALIEAVLLFTLIWSSLTFLRTSNEEELTKRASTAATLFATTTKDAVLATDLASLESFVNEVLRNPGLIYARVVSASDGVLAQSGPTEMLARPFVPDRNIGDVNDGIFDTYAEIAEAGVEYGRVEIGLSVAQIGEVLDKARDRAVTIAAVEMILTALFSLLLGIYLTRQLTGLKEAAQRIAAGDLGYQLMVRGKDELALTAKAFNEMSYKLKVSYAKRQEAEEGLTRLNADLEQRVNLRTKRIAAINKQLEHQALHDPLTKLPNRLLFHDRLEQAVLVAQREAKSLAVLVIDLDGFKLINDTYGHHAGDLVLQQISYRLRDALHESDTIARLGGDEFVALLTGVTDLDATKVTTQKLLETIQEPIVIANERYTIHASVGVALFPEHGEDPDALLSCADVAMYVAKRRKRGVVEYDISLDEQGKMRHALIADLRHAVEKCAFVVHFQPKVDFWTNTISGVSALVRWPRPNYGVLMPDEFISLAEQSGLAKSLTVCILRLALLQCAQWHQKGIDLPVAVNISAANLQDIEFPRQVCKLLEETGVSADAVEMAITETAIMIDPIQAMEVVTQLHGMGIVLSISDFGSGYAFMGYLNKFMLAKLKLDRSVVLGMLENENDAAVVAATIGLAHSLGLKVVAEGVENEALWDQLKTLGCDSAAGYYLSKPISGDEFIAWFEHSPWMAKKNTETKV